MNITFKKELNIIFVFLISIIILLSSICFYPSSFAISSTDFTVSVSSSKVTGETPNFLDGYSYSLSSDGTEYKNIACYFTDFPFYAFLVNDNVYVAFSYEDNNSSNILSPSSITYNKTYSIANNYRSFGLKFTLDADSGICYRQDGAIAHSNGTYFIPSYSSLADGLSALSSYIDSVPSGSLYSFPQFTDSTSINYSHIESNGVWVYSGYNIYSLEGSYSTSSVPVSQYGYFTDNGSTYCVVFSSVPLTVYKAFINGETYSYSVCTQYDEGKYYYVFPEAIENEIQDSFSSLADAQSAFTGASSGSGSASGVVSAGAIEVDVPAGNVLYIKPRAGSIGMVYTQFPVLSSSSAPYWTSRNSTAMWLSGVSSLPSADTTFPLSGMTDIVWAKDDDKVDGYGRSYYGKCSHAPFNSGWFVVYNPTYTRAVTDDYIGQNSATYNPTITVSLQYATEYYIYDLNEAITPTGNTSSSNTDYSSSWGGSYNSTDNQWDKTNTNVDTDSPVSGGQNSASAGASLSVTDYIQSLHNTISNFVDNLLGLLTAPVEHISNLVSHATNFFNVLVSMFSWLPEDVLSIITSALVVLFVIGALKIFSR